MIPKRVTYTDYNGVTRTEDFLFNLTQAELVEMEYTTDGGLSDMIDKLIGAVEVPEIVKMFKNLVMKSYGVKSPDGRRFMKSPEILQAFVETEAYSKIFMELAFDDKAASEFIAGIIPTLTPEQKARLEELKEKRALNEGQEKQPV